LQLSFKSKKIRDVCEDDALARKLFAPSVVEGLQKRLADLQSGANIYELPLETIKIKDNIRGIEIAKNTNLIFLANHNSNPKLEDGRINWKQISRIQIIKIETNE
jgi:proteic killer suppression protein